MTTPKGDLDMTTVRWTRRLGLLILHMVAACQSRGEPEKAHQVVQDETHVELLDIVRQATALVGRLEPGRAQQDSD